MVTIKRIEIEDFLGQGNLVWNLDPEVNILGGKNGSGKSTILRVCYDILAGHTIPTSRYEHLFKEITILFNNGWSVKLETQSFKYSVPKAFNENGESITLLEFYVHTQSFLINSFEQHLSKAINYDQQPKSLPLDDPTMLDLLIYDQINLRNRKFMQAMEGIFDAPSVDDQLRTEYEQNFKKIYESLSHFLQGYDEPFKSSFEFVRNGQKFGYEHLSMGEKQILLLLLMVSNTDQQPCIFLMDEPDLSMHIDWKEILVKELHSLNPNMQIILTTHAPSVITGWHDRVQEVSQLIKN